MLENFDEDLHSPTKCYYVRCSSGKADSDDDERMVIEQRYKVQVLLLGGK